MTIANSVEELLAFDPEPIGRGASGIVRVARDAAGQTFAVKTCVKTRCPRWKDEEAVHSQLDHPHVVPLFHTLHEPDRIHFLMEYCEVGDLEMLLSKESTISEFKAASVVYQMLQSLRYLHRKGFCHADVHLKNFVVQRVCGGPKLCLKLMDFGVGGVLDDDIYFGRLGGTNELLSPEIARALLMYSGTTGASPEEAAAAFRWDGRAADMWALGCVAFSLLSSDRRLPFSCVQEPELDGVILTLAAGQEGDCEEHELQALQAINEQIVFANEAQKLVMFARIADNVRGTLSEQNICDVLRTDAHSPQLSASSASCLFVEKLLHSFQQQRLSAGNALESVWMRSFMFNSVLRCIRKCVRQRFSLCDAATGCCLLNPDLEHSCAEVGGEDRFALLSSDDVEETLACILSFIPNPDASITSYQVGTSFTLTCAQFFAAASHFRAEGCRTLVDHICPCVSPHRVGIAEDLISEVHSVLFM